MLLTWEKQHANKCCRENSENNNQINIVGKRAKTTCKINVKSKQQLVVYIVPTKDAAASQSKCR